ncbi:MAG: Nif3-like dinuclear metal center hexameric protein [Clostridia bacterium]|nr:Nif3-like dinuclear metal center hexameric protein [Clostridia bacterium]
MTTVRKIYEFLDTVCPFSLAEEWDNPGLNVGYADRRVSKVLIALDLTMEVICRAAERGCELIITHHPLIFDPIKQVNGDSAEGRRILALAANNIAHIACHTNLDAAQGGVNDVLAQICGLTETQPFWGIGRIGTAETDLSALIARLKDALQADCKSVRCTEEVSRVAIVGGAGGGALEQPDLLTAGDTYITGEAKHHQLLIARERGINLLVLGHYETEYPVLAPLAQKLRAAFPEITFEEMPFEAPLENV